jgi:hypothetical protein
VAASSDLVAALKLPCLAAFAWHAAAVVGRWRSEAASRFVFAAATGLLWAVVLAMYLYKMAAMVPFNFVEVASSLDDVRRTLVQVLGPHGVALTLGAFAGLLLACTAAVWVLYRVLQPLVRRLAPGARAAVACLGLLCYFGAADLMAAAEQLVFFRSAGFAQRFTPPPLVPDYSAVQVRSGESVFIVQLESVNADAVFERPGDGRAFRARMPQPGLETILKEGGGVLFPLFWANGHLTNRAWESILCSVNGNLGEGFSVDPTRLAFRTCLPGLLADAGYATVFYYAYFDLEFYNFGAFAKRLGFQVVDYGSGLMAKGDPRHDWAYDDCAFYKRAFDRLAESGLGARERVFAYFEVGMNHAPFLNTMKHPEAHPYRAPATMLEHYQNSLAEQDHCLHRFWQRFRELGRDDVHLFILPDHSLWLPGVPLHPDTGFATWFAYIPPARRAAEFRPRVVHAPVPSQAQVFPTILELLGGTPLPSSFAFALRGEPTPPRYDDCHMMGYPGINLVVRRNGERAEFRVGSSELALAGAAPVKSDLNEFLQRYACR